MFTTRDFRIDGTLQDIIHPPRCEKSERGGQRSMGNKPGKAREPIDPQYLKPSGLYPNAECAAPPANRVDWMHSLCTSLCACACVHPLCGAACTGCGCACGTWSARTRVSLVRLPPCGITDDERLLRRLIIERKLAPCYRGLDEPSAEREECPICMLARRHLRSSISRLACESLPRFPQKMLP